MLQHLNGFHSFDSIGKKMIVSLSVSKLTFHMGMSILVIVNELQ
jgi:hypothetical protein